MAGKPLKKVVVEAPVKLNLALDIIGLSANGYHEVDMIMQAVGLYERVEVIRSMGYALRCPGSPVPANDKNTATKVAEAFFRETGLLAGADITLHKRVPTRAGLGGGSADAAGVLVALNAMYSARLSLQEMCKIGLAAGSDVPFSLMGGTARARGIGEKLSALPALPPCWFTIAMPEKGVSTPLAYKRYDELGSPVHPDMPALLSSLKAGELARFAGGMKNALEHASGGDTTTQIKQLFMEQGALGAMMTGSGAAVFGLFPEKGPAQNAAERLRNRVPHVFLAPPVQTGPRVVESY
ncbi:4-(cytidine 5'-diphospho)-2-C-methyl-D-erythritol kinase [Ruminococcaceae bacterium OttesenSCG-928-I18]|nr:4-(cytidine 5'-diphospho)-2-C-methyl-D-erythritol kinase [Ruminococcaceae bacterium OttesenSCG-928-I18]